MNIKISILTALLAMSSTLSFAQKAEYDWNPDTFVGIQGGFQTQPLGGSVKDLYTPHYGVQFGHWFSDIFAMRIQGLAYQSKGELLSGSTSVGYHEYKTWQGKLDMMFNMSNILKPKRVHQNFNWIMFFGIGAHGDWDSDYDCDDAFAPSVGIGTQVEYLFTKNFGINLELQCNYHDIVNFNEKIAKSVSDKNGFQGIALIGLTYHFGHPKKAAPVEAPVVTTENYTSNNNDAELAAAAARKAEADALARAEAAKKKLAEETAAKTAAVAKEEPLKKTIFYQIRDTDPKNSVVLDEVASWAKKNPSKIITVSGYGDKGTGTAPINMRYSQQRVNNVVTALKKRGVTESQLSTKAYGDTVQPYAQNDENRCTIIVGE